MAGAQIRTVLVSPVPGNPTASGTALASALAGITSPSSTNRWLLKVEPGIYDVGTTSLAMRSWVDIEGSGIGVTTIQGSVSASLLNAGTINGANDAELRDLTVIATSTQSAPTVIALFNQQASPRLYRVHFLASGTSAWGIRNRIGAPQIEECEITASGTGAAGATYGIVFDNGSGLPSGRTAIRRSRIFASGAASFNYGIYMTDGQVATEIRDSHIEAVGGTQSVGLHADDTGGWTGSDTLTLRDTEVTSYGASGSSYGVEFGLGANIYLVVVDSQVWGHLAANNYGIVHAGGSSSVNVQGSSLLGSTQVASVSGNLFVASSSLSGGATTATVWAGCAGVWDETATFYANTCPP